MARAGRAERDRSASCLHVGLGRAARTEMPTTTYEDARRLKKACNKCRHIPARETGPCSYDQRVLVVVLSSLFEQQTGPCSDDQRVLVVVLSSLFEQQPDDSWTPSCLGPGQWSNGREPARRGLVPSVLGSLTLISTWERSYAVTNPWWRRMPRT